ncbi:MAG: hypothetical protein Q9226_003411 [Calogaya cf. arnoldii]
MSSLLFASLSYALILVEARLFEQQRPFSLYTTTSIQQHRLNFSSPAPHLFSSVHGFLRQGYNTFFPNGFSIVPCEIPAFTPFYHGWLNDEPPKSPEWLASTPEMAYGIMGSTRSSFLSTYQTTRPVKCLYFDGASGALGENGTMDTQMLFLYGNTTGPPAGRSGAEFLWDEYARAQHLCDWLHQHEFDIPGQGIEGIVRMSAGFEVIWCDFSSPSIQLISRFNASVPLLGYNRTSSFTRYSNKRERALSAIDLGTHDDLPAPDWDIDWEHEPFVASQQWDWFTSTSRTYSSQDLASVRESSITLLDVDSVSLYSPDYDQHLAILLQEEKEHFNLTPHGYWRDSGSRESRRKAMSRLMRRRARHRVGNISPQEVDILRSNVKQMVARVVNRTSHDAQGRNIVCWSRTSDMIIENYARRLMHLQRLLGEGSDGDHESQASLHNSFTMLRERAHALLMPFFEYPFNAETAVEFPEVQVSFDRCKRQYLPASMSKGTSGTRFRESPSHGVIGQAIEEVMDNICTVLIDTGLSIEKTWFRKFNQGAPILNEKQHQILRNEIRTWHDGIEELTAWLGWAPHWMSCNKLCEGDEECYIPMWPLLRQMSAKKPAYGNTLIDPHEVEYDLWHPRCLKVTDFATG